VTGTVVGPGATLKGVDARSVSLFFMFMHLPFIYKMLN
jgi:hypothetical protein